MLSCDWITLVTGERRARRRAVVTGGSSGIGAAIVRALASAGCDVGFTYLSRERAAQAIAERLRGLGVTIEPARVDLADLPRVEPRLEALVDRLGGIDILVNNAGINPRGAILDAGARSWSRTLDVNLIAPVLAARVAARRMIGQASGGRIVNVTSVLGLSALADAGPYCGSKAGLENVTKVMAAEWARHGITVNSVAPGHTATPMNYPDVPDAAEVRRPSIPLGRPAAADEVAAAVSYLVSAAGGYATGSSLLVDGGLLLANGPARLQEEMGHPPATSGGSDE